MNTTIGYCVPEFPSQTHAFFWREAMAMKSEGFDIKFISTQRPDDNACPHAFATEARQSTYYVFPPHLPKALTYLAMHPGRMIASLKYIASLKEASLLGKIRLLLMLLCAVDLLKMCKQNGIHHIHIHSFANSAHLGSLVSRLGAINYSLSLHGDLPVYGTDHARKMEGAAFVTAVTAPLREQIETVLPGRAPLVITMGVDMDRFQPSASGKKSSDVIEVVSISRLNFVKGHAYFLEAMARLLREGIKLRYTIAGEGPYRSGIADKIRELGLADHVKMIGSVSEVDVVGLLQKADLFVLTSFGQGEAAPVAVMEAMACGLPVVCSRIGGTGDMIEDGIDGYLVEQRNIENIADAVRQLSTDPELRQKIGHEARKSAMQKFDYRIKARELCAAIKNASIKSH